MPILEGTDRRRACVFCGEPPVLQAELGGGRRAPLCDRCAAQLARKEYFYGSDRTRPMSAERQRYLAGLRAE